MEVEMYTESISFTAENGRVMEKIADFVGYLNDKVEDKDGFEISCYIAKDESPYALTANLRPEKLDRLDFDMYTQHTGTFGASKGYGGKAISKSIDNSVDFVNALKETAGIHEYSNKKTSVTIDSESVRYHSGKDVTGNLDLYLGDNTIGVKLEVRGNQMTATLMAQEWSDELFEYTAVGKEDAARQFLEDFRAYVAPPPPPAPAPAPEPESQQDEPLALPPPKEE